MCVGWGFWAGDVAGWGGRSCDLERVHVYVCVFQCHELTVPPAQGWPPLCLAGAA